ncbi:uncharacterized protein LOC133195567 [Saccostrea echinata]|uniref:uncharacterized protein LOC133195567 n=1 Tax=Saccostrea echinata TaxID=191078 RepID=UPI002A8364C7|nr:uncharacterized protein LOC133195567 [Saccostrea echinata]
MSTLEVDLSSLDEVASWFGQKLSRKRQLEDSDHANKGNCKKSKQINSNENKEVSKSDSCSMDFQSPQVTTTVIQSTTQNKDASSLSAFIQQKVNKKLTKASHKKREGGYFVKGVKHDRTERTVKYNKQPSPDSSDEEETKDTMISKQAKVSHTSSKPQPKKKRKRKRKRKLTET